MFTTQIDGRDIAGIPELAPLAFAGFAHFTAMQVRDGRVRGLDLHLDRLRSASLKLFGRAMADDVLLLHLRAALAAGPRDLSLTATMFSRSGEFTAAGIDDAPSVLVRTNQASNGPQGPLRLTVVEHERALPEVKHVGEVSKTYSLHQATRQGFDDAVFVDRRGRFSEATIWNLAFWDDDTVIWPEADMLRGTTMGIVSRQLDRIGIPQRRQAITSSALGTLAGAAVMNSWTPGVPVAAIGALQLPDAPAFIELLHRAYQGEQARSLLDEL